MTNKVKEILEKRFGVNEVFVEENGITIFIDAVTIDKDYGEFVDTFQVRLDAEKLIEGILPVIPKIRIIPDMHTLELRESRDFVNQGALDGWIEATYGLYKIKSISEDFVVRTGYDLTSRSFCCTPDTPIFVRNRR